MIQVADIYSARKKLGLSQEKLAEALGVSRNTVSRWELGEFSPSAENLAALERLLAQLEGDGPAEPEDTPAPEEAVVPPPVTPAKTRRWPLALVCAGVVCALLLGIAALIGVHSLRQRVDPDNAVPAEEMDREEVDESIIIMEPGTLHP